MNFTKQNKQFDTNKILQSVISLGSERPEESNSRTDSIGDSPKIRVRYSGAARRRYKKQLQKEKEATETQTSSTEVMPNSKAEGIEAPVVTPKRVCPELSIPSPTDTHQSKRLKISDQESYVQAIKSIVKLALTLEDYPDKKLAAEECNMIRKLIRERILELPEDTKAPTFSGSWERDGALVFTCADEQSGNWLKRLSSDLKLGESSLRVLPLDELPKRHRVVVHVEEPDVSAEEVLRLLCKQNADLATSDWIVIRGSKSRDATNTHFACLVRDSSLEALKACNFRPFCGLGRATVKLLEKEHKRDSESVKETVEEAMAVFGAMVAE